MSLWNPADTASYYCLVSRVSAIRQKYEAEDTQYERYSNFTDKKVEEGREEGIAIGEERGIEKGAHQKALEMARNLLKIGLPIDQIILVTGLSKKEIEDLA
jgi:predicted transposase/invertase (TIGR01784 family)